ncbi:hypothetical protein N9B21_00275 [Verrucomicrobiales bacterium]|nr:hypothetical protein [Verrucomicrobiales bacterium]MDA7926453.1 hypothetical protein [Verrucomicrobiales bacterium]
MAKGLWGHSSLWRGGDHLVYVNGRGILIPLSEEYKRYKYSEIQALSIARTSRLGKGFLHGAGFVFFSAIIALILVLIDDYNTGLALVISGLVVGALVSIALLLRHLILGPTCVCEIRTSISKERLKPLNRYHRAKEIVAQLDEHIRESQKTLNESGAGPGTESVIAAPPSTKGDFFQIGKLTIPTFVGFSVFGLVALAALHLESVVTTGVLLFLILVVSLLLTFSLIGSVRKPTPEPVRIGLWSLLGLLFLFLGAGAIYFLIVATQNPAYTLGIMGPLEAYTAVASEGGMLGYGVFLGLGLGFLVASMVGIFKTMKWSRQIERSEELVRAADTESIAGAEDE